MDKKKIDSNHWSIEDENVYADMDLDRLHQMCSIAMLHVSRVVVLCTCITNEMFLNIFYFDFEIEQFLTSLWVVKNPF